MSRAKELKNSSDNNLNLYDYFSLFIPNKKSKYTELLLKIMKKTPDLSRYVNDIKDRLQNEFKISKSDLDQVNDLHLLLFYRMVDGMFNINDLVSFQRFCEYNERNLIEQNDLSRYNNFEDVLNQLSLAEINVETKNLEKQVKVVYQDDEWLLIRPLTYAASKKYGSNTKWCTTQTNNPEYFLKYANKGVLIYCINKKTGYKVAAFCSLDKNDSEFSFWNQKDSRVDSIETELTPDLLTVILKESKTPYSKTNRFLLSDEEREKEDLMLNNIKREDYELRAVEAESPELPMDMDMEMTAESPTELPEPVQDIQISNENGIGVQNYSGHTGNF
jgi:hypothetical protein